MEYDPFSPTLLADPYPAYRRLRDEAPLYRQPTRRVWLVSRFEHLLERFPRYEVDGPLRWLPNHSTRALVQLPVTLHPD